MARVHGLLQESDRLGRCYDEVARENGIVLAVADEAMLKTYRFAFGLSSAEFNDGLQCRYGIVLNLVTEENGRKK